MLWWHPGSKCFEELKVGDRYVTPSRTVSESDIQTFAGLSGDYHPLHTDEIFAQESLLGGRVCHGLLSMSMLTGLFMGRLGLFDTTGLALLALENLRFLEPVRVGDTIHAELQVDTMRESKTKPDFGIVVFRIDGVNQKGERFLDCEWHEWMTRLSWKEKQSAAFHQA
jgi:acyl dehydratase